MVSPVDNVPVTDAAPHVSDPAELSSYAVNTYRYLRIAIVVVILALLCAVAIERGHANGCFEESISAYYYTPVHSVFIGALVVLGVCLIAIRGCTDVEDVLLNIAGVLAPVVAFVPTVRPSPLCTEHPLSTGDTLPYINNNLVAYGAALVLAFVVAAVTIFNQIESDNPTGAAAISTVLLVVSLAVIVLLRLGQRWVTRHD